MHVQCLSSGQRLRLDHTAILGSGGEAYIYAVPHDHTLVAKVYRIPDPTQADKLAVMVRNPPDNPLGPHGHIAIAWPVSLLASADGQQVVGFLMPRVTGLHPLITCYNPAIRRQQRPLFNYRYLLRTAHNLAVAVQALHTRGYVIGDLNESNILVTDTALVTLVDTDSFQVRAPQNGVLYRCPVGKPEFTPPELQGQSFRHIDRTPEQDRFGLAALIFQLLMEGTPPFTGVYPGPGEPPPYERRIALGHFPYSRTRQVPAQPKPSAPPYTLLPPTLQDLFARCFETGHTQPLARPPAHTWQDALHAAEQALISCAANDQHLYSPHLSACPWCARTQQLGGRDPFPSRQAVQHAQARPSGAAFSAVPTPPGPPPSPAVSLSAMPSSPSPGLASPSRLGSMLTGACWGTLSGVLLNLLVAVRLQDELGAVPWRALLGETLQSTGGSALWGLLWGTMWGLWRRPGGSGHRSRARRLLTGAVLGAVWGVLISALLDVTPGFALAMPSNSLLAMLGNAATSLSLPLWRELGDVCLAALQRQALPGAMVGTALGAVWGVWR